jgi:hypothetical protein
MLRRGKYDGFNDQHFREKLVKVEGVELSRETVRFSGRKAFRTPFMAIATAVYDATTSTGPARRSWQAGKSRRVLANLGVEMRYALSAQAKGRLERLWGVALHYLRKVHKNRTLRLHGRVLISRDDPTRGTRPTWGRRFSSNTCFQATTAYSTRTNASHGLADHGRSLQQAAIATMTRTSSLGVTFPRSS